MMLSADQLSPPLPPSPPLLTAAPSHPGYPRPVPDVTTVWQSAAGVSSFATLSASSLCLHRQLAPFMFRGLCGQRLGKPLSAGFFVLFLTAYQPRGGCTSLHLRPVGNYAQGLFSRIGLGVCLAASHDSSAYGRSTLRSGTTKQAVLVITLSGSGKNRQVSEELLLLLCQSSGALWESRGGRPGLSS